MFYKTRNFRVIWQGLFLGLCTTISGMVLAGSLKEILPGSIEDFSQEIKDVKSLDEIVLNVFIHGTYEVGTIPLNFFTSFWDKDLRGSIHEKLVRDFMRKQIKSVFETSLMYYEGFFRAKLDGPEESLKELEDLALLPILRSFDSIEREKNKKLRPDKKIHSIDYLFGWSGLLNAQARREAGIALFNAISFEKDRVDKFLKSKKSKAKVCVRLFCHSHGGNVALNLGWACAKSRGMSAAKFYSEFDLESFGKEAEEKFDQLISKIPDNYEDSIGKSPYGMDNWLFKPQKSVDDGPLVDQLYLVASPIQPETWPLIFCDAFLHVISLFSNGDNIQNLDMISTKNRCSDRFVLEHIAAKGNRLFSRGDGLRLVQINVILPHSKECFDSGLNEGNIERSWIKSRISNLVSGQSIIPVPEISGPRHLEFWYICWEGISNRLCIRPVPIVVFSTMIDQPWLMESRFIIKFACSQDGDLIIKRLGSENDRGFDVISVCQKELFEAIKEEFFKRSDVLRNIKSIKIKALNKLLSGIGNMALFMATS